MENMLSTVVHSFTKDRDYTVCISNNFLTADDRILFLLTTFWRMAMPQWACSTW